jgi:hypothetical protein
MANQFTQPDPRRKFCACGCGRLAKIGRNYVKGHKPQTPEGRVMARVSVDAHGCWIFNGARTTAGYGHLNIGAGSWAMTHVITYEHHIGAVPRGLELDHLCRVRACCNPAHLEPVTHTENVRRGDAAIRSCAHPEGELYRRKSNGRLVYCRACRREKRRAEG